ncbi:MAG TPA: hypothetical protein VGA78_10195 [Gemmatimonadales bacterium]
MGSVVQADVDWSATGGTIGPDGVFVSDQLGQFQVTAKLRTNAAIADSARVSVFLHPTDIVKLTVTPNGMEVTVGEGLQLEAVAELADGRTVRQPPLAWTAAAGEVDGSGYYVAPEVEGVFAVQAAAGSGVKGEAAIRVKNSRRTLGSVQVSPADATLLPGQTARFSAMGTYDDGSARAVQVVWSSTGGSIGGDGWFTAGSSAGTFRVIARFRQGTQADTAVVRIEEPQIVGLQISPDGSALTTGASQTYVATARMSDGSSKAVGARWEATGGSINSGGLYTAGSSAGSYRVVGSVAGTSAADTAAVTVSAPVVALTAVILNPSSASVPVGTSRQFNVSGTWSDGSTQTPPVVWSATGGSVSTGGLYQAGNAPGTYLVIATSPAWGKADTATVVVGAPELLTLTIDPASASVLPGQSRQFSVGGSWSDGSSTTPLVNWIAGGGIITSAGLYTAGSNPGTFQVVAVHSSGNADTSLVTIAPPPPSLLSLSLTPTSANLAPGSPAQFSVSGAWSDGGSGTPSVTYSSTGGSISAGGLYTAGSVAGTYRVIAQHTGGTLADTSTIVVSVSAPTLTVLTIAPKTTSLQTGGTRQFSVSGTWSDGSTTPPAVAWTTNVGTVTNAGLYVAPATTGTYRVIASQVGGSRADTATVTVTAAVTIVALEVTPDQKNMQPGQTQQYSAQATYSNGGTGTPTMSWSSSGGLVTSGGLYTAPAAAGGYLVIAQASGSTLRDTAQVTVSAPSTGGTTVTVTPSTLTLDIGEVYQFAALARLSDGSTQTTGLIWSTTGGGLVDGTGQYRAPRTAGIYPVTVQHSSGATSQATVTVVVPSAPYFSDSFDGCGSLNKTANAAGFRWADTQGGVGEDPGISSAIARSGSCSLKFTFVGSSNMADDSWSEQRFAFGKKLSEVYVGWYQYFPSGLESPAVGPKFVHRNDPNGPDNNKLLRLWDEDYSQYNVKAGFSMLPSSTGDGQLNTEYIWRSANGSGNSVANVGPWTGIVTNATRGTWAKFRVRMKLATSATANDGIVQLWLNDVLTANFTTLPLYTAQAGAKNWIRNGYIMGWSNSGFTQTTHTYIDDFVISGNPIP